MPYSCLYLADGGCPVEANDMAGQVSSGTRGGLLHAERENEKFAKLRRSGCFLVNFVRATTTILAG